MQEHKGPVNLGDDTRFVLIMPLMDGGPLSKGNYGRTRVRNPILLLANAYRNLMK